MFLTQIYYDLKTTYLYLFDTLGGILKAGKSMGGKIWRIFPATFLQGQIQLFRGQIKKCSINIDTKSPFEFNT